MQDRDWSSDVCSSDLAAATRGAAAVVAGIPAPAMVPVIPAPARLPPLTALERAFVRIGFKDNGARKLCSVDGENVTLDACLTWMIKW